MKTIQKLKEMKNIEVIKIYRKCEYKHPKYEDDIEIFHSYKNEEYYYCKKCMDIEQKRADREDKIEKHNLIQKQKAGERRFKAYEYYRKENDGVKKLWNYYVESQLIKGIQNSYLIGKIPKEILHLKRATIKLNRFIKTIKEKQNV